MMRTVIHPIIFLRELPGTAIFYINGFDVGYKTFCWRKKESLDVHRMTIDSNVLSIEINESGTYCCHLEVGENKTDEQEFYFMCETSQEVIEKVADRIKNIPDRGLVESILTRAQNPKRSFSEYLVQEYEAIKNLQAKECSTMAAIISIMSKYENMRTMQMNKTDLYGADLFGGTMPDFGANISSVEVYTYKNDIRMYVDKFAPGEHFPVLTPGIMYYMDAMDGTELIGEFVYYQPDEKIGAINWQKVIEQEEETAIGEDMLFSHVGISISAEDAARILQERQRKNCNPLFSAPIIVSGRAGNIAVIISEYAAMQEAGKKYYLSVRDSEDFTDTSFNQWYEINDDVIILNLKQELLSGEIIFYIEDENNNILSDFTRFNTEEEMNSYASVKNAVEVNEFIRTFKADYVKQYGNDENSKLIFPVLDELLHDTDGTPLSIVRSLIFRLFSDMRFHKNRSNILYFTLANWLSRYSYDKNFFETRPVFTYALDTIEFTPQKDPYMIVIKNFDSEEETVSTEYVRIDNEAKSILISESDMKMIFAVNLKDYRYSGSIFVNNGEEEYYLNAIDLEVK